MGLFKWFKESQSRGKAERAARYEADRDAVSAKIFSGSHGGGWDHHGREIASTMTPYEEGHTDGEKGRANRYGAKNFRDPKYNLKEIAKQLSHPGTPAAYKKGYREATRGARGAGWHKED
jgi:hypothetical protein